MMKKFDIAIISVAIVVAFGLCGYLIGHFIEHFRNGDRTIQVKGFPSVR